MSVPTTLTRTLQCKQGAVRNVRFNVDGNYCLSCGSDKTLKLWNPHKGLILKTYTGHGYEVLDACSSGDNAQIASGSLDKMILLWDVETGKPLRKFKGHTARINAVGMNEESSVIFSGGLDGAAMAWDTRSHIKKPIQVMDEATDSVTSLAVGGHEFVCGSADGRVRRYDLRGGQMYVDFIGTTVTSVSFTKDDQCVLVSSLDSTLRLLDKETGELLQEFSGHKNTEYKVDSCLMSTDAQVASGSEDGKLYCWDLVEGKLLHRLSHPTNQVVHSVSAHPTRQCLLSVCVGTLYFWTSPDDVDDSDDEQQADDRHQVTVSGIP